MTGDPPRPPPMDEQQALADVRRLFGQLVATRGFLTTAEPDKRRLWQDVATGAAPLGNLSAQRTQMMYLAVEAGDRLAGAQHAQGRRDELRLGFYTLARILNQGRPGPRAQQRDTALAAKIDRLSPRQQRLI